MKIAFHFNAFHPELGANYADGTERLLFSLILGRRNLNLSSKILTGDLLLSNLALDTKTRNENSESWEFNKEKYFQIINLWLRPENAIWSSMNLTRLTEALRCEIFAICFETIEMELVNHLDDQLMQKTKAYLGALEVDEASYIHWYIYSHCIGPRYRINNKTASIFWDGFNEEAKCESQIDRLRKFGFSRVSFESLNGRYTIFDEYHDFEHARRIAEWKKSCGNLLAFIVDGVAHRLGDSAPDLGNKLWAALKTFNEAETNEEFAQVTASCRRIIEYISDELFPPIEGGSEEHKLGTKQYRNRLLAFADKARKSDTNIDLIWISTKTLSEQMEKLSSLANKGVHAEVYRLETRRCLLRTIILLDDIVGSIPLSTK